MANFGDALANIQNGGTHRRSGWTPALTNYISSNGSTITRKTNGVDAPWAETHADLLAEDWIMVSEGSGP